MPSNLKNKLSMPPAKDPMLEDEELDLEEDMGPPEEGEEEMEYPMSVEEMMKALEEKGYTVQEPDMDMEDEELDLEELPEEEDNEEALY